MDIHLGVDEIKTLWKSFQFCILAQNILCCDINHELLVTLLCFINWLSARVDIFSKKCSSVVPNRFIGNTSNVLRNNIKTNFCFWIRPISMCVTEYLFESDLSKTPAQGTKLNRSSTIWKPRLYPLKFLISLC